MRDRGTKLAALLGIAAAAVGACSPGIGKRGVNESAPAPFASRPRALIESMAPGPLRDALEQCASRPFRPTAFSIAHRGAPLGYPEHTRESYEAAAQMGAGLIECDVTFTRDRKLVCRHSQCDLHTTTNILTVPALAAKCSVPFAAADPATGMDASARCCTSDVTLAEFESLCGKMDGFDPKARTPAEYTSAHPGAAPTCGKVMSHRESIALIDHLGRDFIPELKAPSGFMDALLSEYEAAGIDPKRVFVQSANLADVTSLLEQAPAFGKHAVFLDERVDLPGGYDAAVADLPRLSTLGIRIVAPPLWALVTLDERGKIVPSAYARAARAGHLDVVTWTLERSGSLASGGGYYYSSIAPAVTRDGDAYVVLDVLARQVGIRGIFSDWPATVTYYANCMGL